MLIKDHDEEFIQQMKTCTECDLHKSRTQVVVGDYGPKGGICFVGEAPGYNEDKQGRPFVGRSGKLLNKNLSFLGLDREDVSVLNIIKCRPPNNRNPTGSEMNICGSLWLDTQLNYINPLLIVTLGSVAINYFIPGVKITRIKGQLQRTDDGYSIIPMFHPAYVLRNGDKMSAQYQEDFKKMYKIFNDLKKAESIEDYLTEEEDKSSTDFTPDQKSLDDFF